MVAVGVVITADDAIIGMIHPKKAWRQDGQYVRGTAAHGFEADTAAFVASEASGCCQ